MQVKLAIEFVKLLADGDDIVWRSDASLTVDV